MAYRVNSLDKRSGITYVYDVDSYWDKAKKQSRSRRTLVGKIDPSTGQMVPTDGRGKRRAARAQRVDAAFTAIPRQGPVPAIHTARQFYGATYLLDQIGIKTGITADLKQCFPRIYKAIMSLSYFMVLQPETAISNFERWSELHRHPFGENIPSQRSSELFQSITEKAKMDFFRLQGKRRANEEYWAYDSTSISSYSRQLKQVKWGKNRDDEPLPQINLALIFGEKSGLPFYFRKMAGNIPDVKTLKELLRELKALGFEKVKLVMDRGYYSTDNVNSLYKEHLKFIIGATTALAYAKAAIRKHGEEMRQWVHYNEQYRVYYHSETIAWDYMQERPYKGDVIEGEKRMYLHLFYNPEKALEDEMNFNDFITRLHQELLTGKRIPEHENAYGKFFTTKVTPVRGVRVEPIQAAMNKAKSRYGYFVLLSNEVKDPIVALELYRNRDVVEKAFSDVKDRLNGRRTLVSSEQSLNGKLFVQFLALIYLSYVKKHMQEHELFKKYTMQGLLNELERIECFIEPGKAPFIGEVLTKQVAIYEAMGVCPPQNAASFCEAGI